MLAAALKHDVIRGIIPMSPAVTIPEDARCGNVLGLEFDPDHIPEEVSFPNGFVLSGNHIRVSQMIRVEDAIDRYTGPVLLIHGEMDETIPVQASVDAAKHYQNAQLVIIPGDTHCYDCHLDEVLAAIRQWMPKV